MNRDNDQPRTLSHRLSSCYVTMILIGGVIGAGLFVGSSAAIASVGPAVVVSYLLAGLLIVFIMRMLGEMAVAVPGAGSFTEYVRIGLGDRAGFVTGWLYWYFGVMVVAIEAIAGAKLLESLLGSAARVPNTAWTPISKSNASPWPAFDS